MHHNPKKETSSAAASSTSATADRDPKSKKKINEKSDASQKQKPPASPPPPPKVKGPTVDEFLINFRKETQQSLMNAYLLEHDLDDNDRNDVLTTSLCEDVFSLIHVLLEAMQEYLKSQNMLTKIEGKMIVVDAMLSIVHQVHSCQMKFRDQFLLDFESCCAAANDFYRMMENLEELMENLESKFPSVKNNSFGILDREASDLITLLGADAVYAATRAQTFVIQSLQESEIPEQLFSREWEEKLIHNEVAISVIKTMEDYLYDFHNYLATEELYTRTVAVLVPAVITFYVKCLMRKADDIRRKKRGARSFQIPARALLRMMYDVQIFQTYFGNLAKQLPAISRLIEDELGVLVVVHECLGMSISVNGSELSALEDFVVVVHKRTGLNIEITRCFLTDLWLLMNARQNVVINTIQKMRLELQLLSDHTKVGGGEILRVDCSPIDRNSVLEGMGLKSFLADLYRSRIARDHTHPLCGACVQGIHDVADKTRELKAATNVPSLKQPFLSQEERKEFHFDPAEVKAEIQQKIAKLLRLRQLKFSAQGGTTSDHHQHL